MKLKKLVSPERIALTVLALLVVSVFLIPWSEFAPDGIRDHALTRSSPESIGGRDSSPKKSASRRRLRRREGGDGWQADVEFKAARGTLSIDLRNKDANLTKGLMLQAQFSSVGSSPSVVRTWLREQSDGRYRANHVGLKKGNWIMTLTGRRNSQFEFSVEQPLTIR